MIKNIIFDLGGVVIKWDPEAIFSSYRGDVNIPLSILKSNFLTKEWSDFDRGTISYEDLVLRATEITGNTFEECNAFLEHIKISLTNIPETIQLIEEVHAKRYGLFCLSNMSHHFWDYLKDREVFSLFDGIVISAQEKLIKPDPQIYHLLLERYNINAGETLFIDDLLPNIEAAKSVGLNAIQFSATTELYNKIRNLIL